MSEYSQYHVPKILIVDDSLSDILVMQKALAGLGDIYNAASGRQALDQLQLIKPEIVVLDIEMPDISGLEICQTIRDMPELCGTRVIFVTMHEDNHTEYLSFKSGADDFIMKPYSMNICRFRVQNQIRVYYLAQQAGNLMSILDGVANTVSVWTENEQCLYANASFLKAFSLKPSAIQGLSMQRLFGKTVQSLIWQKAEQQQHADVTYQSDNESVRLLSGSVHKQQLANSESVLVLTVTNVDYQPS